MIELPQDVAFIIHKIEKAGFEAFAVGGCIRDSLLSRTPNDWDITTSALPEQVKALLPPTIDTVIKHGTVTVMCHHVGYEVTTYRIDGEYEDGRHPKQVVFTPSLIEDLKRRDFTINAMAYNDSRGLVDAFEGQQDLQKGVIRAVGEPEKRFSEDALRIMRAVRFAAQLGYTIEEETEAAMCRLSDTLTKISAERIQVELVKLLVSLFLGHTLVACLEPEVHCGIEARHIGESRAYIHPFFYNWHRQVETHAICSERYAQFYIILCHRHIRGHDCCCKNSNNSFHTLLYIIIISVAKLRIIIETPKKISKNFTFLSREREFYA